MKRIAMRHRMKFPRGLGRGRRKITTRWRFGRPLLRFGPARVGLLAMLGGLLRTPAAPQPRRRNRGGGGDGGD